MATKQQIFDAAWNGLKAQGFEIATSPPGQWGGNCQLENDRGQRCALGWVNYTLTGNACDFSACRDSGLRNALLACHNLATSPADMERRYREYAAAHNLTIPGDDFARFMAKVREPVSLTDAEHLHR